MRLSDSFLNAESFLICQELENHTKWANESVARENKVWALRRTVELTAEVTQRPALSSLSTECKINVKDGKEFSPERISQWEEAFSRLPEMEGGQLTDTVCAGSDETVHGTIDLSPIAKLLCEVTNSVVEGATLPSFLPFVTSFGQLCHLHTRAFEHLVLVIRERLSSRGGKQGGTSDKTQKSKNQVLIAPAAVEMFVRNKQSDALAEFSRYLQTVSMQNDYPDGAVLECVYGGIACSCRFELKTRSVQILSIWPQPSLFGVEWETDLCDTRLSLVIPSQPLTRQNVGEIRNLGQDDSSANQVTLNLNELCRPESDRPLVNIVEHAILATPTLRRIRELATRRLVERGEPYDIKTTTSGNGERKAPRNEESMKWREALDVRMFKALSDRSRLALFEFLAERQASASVAELAKVVPDLDISVVSRHLRTLAEAELLSVTRDGKSKLYSIACRKVCRRFAEISEWLERYCS